MQQAPKASSKEGERRKKQTLVAAGRVLVLVVLEMAASQVKGEAAAVLILPPLTNRRYKGLPSNTPRESASRRSQCVGERRRAAPLCVCALGFGEVRRKRRLPLLPGPPVCCAARRLRAVLRTSLLFFVLAGRGLLWPKRNVVRRLSNRPSRLERKAYQNPPQCRPGSVKTVPPQPSSSCCASSWLCGGAPPPCKQQQFTPRRRRRRPCHRCRRCPAPQSLPS